WYVAKGLPSHARESGLEANLFVASAGYGLLPSDALLRPYAATFSPRSPDSVARSGDPSDAAATWWSRLGSWKGPKPGAPRTLTALAAANRDAVLLVAVSAAYLGALAPDLEAAAEELDEPERLMILCAGIRDHARLRPHLLPCDARLQAELGGARQSLNVR